MKDLDIKLNKHFLGKVVRKDLTKLVKGNAIVPAYVLEYLLGQYCATDDSETIKEGVESVKNIISSHFVHREESEQIKSKIRENGKHRIIDKVSVSLNDKRDVYEATFINLGLKKIEISADLVKLHPKLLSNGIWCIINMEYFAIEDGETAPWHIGSLKPIQISNVSVDEYKEARNQFSTEEWIDLLLQSMGLQPEEFTKRSKLIQLSRLVPYAENNYNLIELGPKGTGKSHIYSELSPHGILISGGEVTKAKLFVDNKNGNIGLVGYWDVVAYDEFAGTGKSVDRGLVDIMKNYMANKSFSRGTEVFGASASMVFVGNTDHSVAYMLKHSHLFDALPSQYADTAFLDRIHCYVPGWEVQKLRNEMFTNNYGFIVDYLSEVMKQLRREDYTQDFKKYFVLSDSITTRDKDSITKTFSGLLKVIYPHGKYTEEEAKEIMDFAIENRKRVKLQLIKMDETFEHVDFSYTSKATGETYTINTLESIEYGFNEDVQVKHSTIDESESDSVDFSAQPVPVKKVVLREGNTEIRDNQEGVSYDHLFGDYFVGAKEIVIVDPFIRMPHQFRNLMELLKVILTKKEIGEEITIHVVTGVDEDYKYESDAHFTEIGESITPLGVYFSYEIDNGIHDRSIQIDNKWKILLGRGLDMFQKPLGRYDIAEVYPEIRKCRECNITYIKK